MSYVPLNPIPLKDRVSLIFLQYGHIDVIDGAFVLVDKTGVRTHIPVGSVACIMLEPGTRVSHAAVRLAAQVGTLLVWVGEGGVRVYASGQPGGVLAAGEIAPPEPPPDAQPVAIPLPVSLGDAGHRSA